MGCSPTRVVPKFDQLAHDSRQRALATNPPNFPPGTQKSGFLETTKTKKVPLEGYGRIRCTKTRTYRTKGKKNGKKTRFFAPPFLVQVLWAEFEASRDPNFRGLPKTQFWTLRKGPIFMFSADRGKKPLISGEMDLFRVPAPDLKTGNGRPDYWEIRAGIGACVGTQFSLQPRKLAPGPRFRIKHTQEAEIRENAPKS